MSCGSNCPGRGGYAPAPRTERLPGAETGLQDGVGAQALNPAWQAMAVGAQAKLSVSQPGDAGEVEADRVADAIVDDRAVPEIRQSPRRVARKCAACAGDAEPCPQCQEEAEIQRKAGSGGSGGQVADGFGSRLGAGAPLGAGDRRFYESRMGHDFGDVRIHTGGRANDSARAIGARAYTLGNDIAFAGGEFDTSSAGGRHLLGHELAHVVQQRGGARSVQRAPGPHDEEIERSRISPGHVATDAPPPRVSLYNFAIDEFSLKEEHEDALEQLAAFAVAGQIRNLRLTGHTDSYGDDAINGPLSNDRAMEVEEFLHQCGATVSGVSSRGSGSPVVDNGTEEGRSRNRRVDITFDYTPPPPPPPHRDEDHHDDPDPTPDDDDDDWDWPRIPDIPDVPHIPDIPTIPTLPNPCIGPVGALLCFCAANPEICALPFALPLLPDWDDDDDDDPDDEPEHPDDLDCGDPELPLTHVEFDPAGGDRGNHVTARPLTRCEGNTHGSRPDIPHLFPDIWYNCIRPAVGSYRFVHAHLLHGRTGSSTRTLHGPGDDVRNIIFADRSINAQMSFQVEQPAIHLVWDNDAVLWYDVRVNHFTGPYPWTYFAESMDMEFGMHDPLTGIDSPPLIVQHVVSNVGHLPPVCDDPHAPDDTDTDDDPDGHDVEPEVPEPEPQPQAPEPEPSHEPPEPDQGFDSTIQICRRLLESRHFDVVAGRLSVEIDAGWLDDMGDPANPENCPMTEFHVTLMRDVLGPDDEIGTVTFPVGRRAHTEWTDLSPGTYYLVVWTNNDRPGCCLTGDIRVRTPGVPWWIAPDDGVA